MRKVQRAVIGVSFQIWEGKGDFHTDQNLL